MNSAVVFLTLAAVAATHVADRWTRLYLWTVAFALVAAIGLSRAYLGVHYPTDVIGGWLAGAAWAAACWQIGGALPLTVHPAKARRP